MPENTRLLQPSKERGEETQERYKESLGGLPQSEALLLSGLPRTSFKKQPPPVTHLPLQASFTYKIASAPQFPISQPDHRTHVALVRAPAKRAAASCGLRLQQRVEDERRGLAERRRPNLEPPGGAHGQAGQAGQAARARHPGTHPQRQGHLPGAADAGGGGRAGEGLRRHPRAVLRHAAAVRVRRDAARVELPLPGGLRGPREAGHRDHLPAVRAQDQVPLAGVHPARQPRVRLDHAHLRLLRGMQESLQRQALEVLRRLLQLHARGRPHRGSHPLHARRTLARPGLRRADQRHRAAHRHPRYRPALRPAVGRPRGQRQDVGRVRARSELRLRPGDHLGLPEEERAGPDLQGASGGRGRLRVLRQEAAGHCLLGAQLLRRVQQQWSYDADRGGPDLLLPGAAARGEDGGVQEQPPQDAHQARRRMMSNMLQSPIIHLPSITITHSLRCLLQMEEKVYLVCLNPHCLRPKERCLTTATLHSHPKDCVDYYYPADEIADKHWTQLEKYPVDSLGVAAKKKFALEKQRGYLSSAIEHLRVKFEAALKELEAKVMQIYPEKEFMRSYMNVYNLEKISECLRLRKSPTYISGLISDNFSAHNYHVLLRANESYDDLRNTIEGLSSKLTGNFDAVLNKHRQAVVPSGGKKVLHKKINYGIFKSKFIASSKIEFDKTVVSFPKLANIASFLPWVYTDRPFADGTHEFKISSLKYPIVQNTGFTVLEEHDIDTYPYSHFKSLFNREGRGFRLIQGEEIDQFISQTTVLILRLELGPSPRAVIHDSEMKGCYECLLKEQTNYRMGVYGCGWAMEIIELN